MLNIFVTIKNKLAAAGGAVKHLLVAVFGQDAADQFVKAAEKVLATDFGKEVQTVVAGLVSVAEAKGGEVARTEALAAVKTQAVASGLDIKDSLINLVVELAVNKLKGTLVTLGTV
jgi:hypothetical protein